MSNRAFITSIMVMVLSMISLMVATASAQIVPSPAPAPTSDGSAIDQGIACILMMLALLLTYCLH